MHGETSPEAGQSRYVRPQKSYFICTTARSGSSLFCNALCGTGMAGNPDEYFGENDQPAWDKKWGPPSSYSEHLDRVFREATTPNGVCGVKVFIVEGYQDEYLYDFTRKAAEFPQYKGRGLSAAELVADIFPDLHYIWLTRRNKVRQAVSFSKALQTKVWMTYRLRENKEPQLAVYDFQKIRKYLHHLVLQEARWQEYFTAAGVKPLTVVYEDFVQEYRPTLQRVLAFLGMELPEDFRPLKPFLVKQADEESERWVQRYYKDSGDWYEEADYAQM